MHNQEKRVLTRELYQDETIEIRIATELEYQQHHAAIQRSWEDIARWEGWCNEQYSLEDSRRYLIRSQVMRLNGSEYNFCLFSRNSGEIFGSIGLNRIRHEVKTANVGYWIRSDMTGRSLAVLAVKAIAHFAFEQLGMTRLEILALTENQRSRRVAEKAGALYEGLQRNRLYLHNKPQDAVIYSLIPEDLLVKKD